MDIAGCEEDLSAAEGELARLKRLGETLDRTRDFLQQARDRVHRRIAPQLVTSLERHLEQVTAGRYSNASVDPESLEVSLRAADDQWRGATRLSHGTAEQVYLLLRVALAEQFTAPGEVCPILLDDVTVHFDARRKIAVLETLRAISRERQVVVFTQEAAVLEWAGATLFGPHERVVRLPGVLVVATPA
jgi:uncharacterized protein YhaN